MREKKTGISNTGLKLLSVLLSILLWFFVIGQGELSLKQNQLEVELNYKNLANNLSIEGPRTVTVRVWGLFRESQQITASVDLSNRGEGNYNLPVKVEPVSGALITTVNPDKIMVSLKKLGENLLPINHQLINKPPAGYQLLGVVLSPEKCLIKGDQNQITRVTQVVCPVNLADVTEVKNFTAGLEARDSKGNQVSGVELLPNTVQVYAVVQHNKTSRELPVKVLLVGELGTEYELGQVTVEPELATVLGDENLVKQMDNLETSKINVSGHTESYTQEIKITVPEGAKVYPEKVLVMIEIRKLTAGEE